MKKTILLLITIIISVILLVSASYYQINRLLPSLPTTSLNYHRAEVTEILYSGSETSDGIIDQTVRFNAIITFGELKGKEVTATQSHTSYIVTEFQPVSVGDNIILSQSTAGDWSFTDYIRSDYLVILLVLFILVLLAFGKGKGIKTALTLLFTIAAILFVLIPSILLGDSIVLWTFLVCIFITVSTLLIVNGYTFLSLSSIVGCLGGIGVASLFIVISKPILHLTGYLDEESTYVYFLGVNLTDVLYGAMVIASIGAIMDVAVNISASLHELSIKTEQPTFRSLFSSGITIGRDILGTMTNTLILAFVGSSLCSILLTIYYNASNPLILLNKEKIIYELLQILIGSLALLLTIPFSALVSSFLFSRKSFLNAIKLQKEKEKEHEIDSYTQLVETINSKEDQNQQ